MFKNQYIISSKKEKNNYNSIYTTYFNGLYIHAHKKLEVLVTKSKTSQIALIGEIFNPFKPTASNKNIVEKLAEKCSSVEEFHKGIQTLSGRYVILFKNASSFIVSGDACHLRRIYYTKNKENITLTSSTETFLGGF